MPAQLVALDSGPSILLDKPILLLGRHPECDIQIDSRKISRRHCCIAQVSDYLVVRDLGSTNGIRINGMRTLEGQLNAGDELTIGNYRYRVSWDADMPVSAPQSVAQPQKSAKGESKLRRPTGRGPSPVKGVEDEMLESCDDPVALDEPEANEAHDAPPPESPNPESERPIKDQGLDRSDKLGLRPNSDVFRKDSHLASPSGSHHPH
ncbi:MAG TPA: FHA domain-containing protein [Gemmataceae bacterium]